MGGERGTGCRCVGEDLLDAATSLLSECFPSYLLNCGSSRLYSVSRILLPAEIGEFSDLLPALRTVDTCIGVNTLKYV